MNTDTGKVTPLFGGLQMANGVARGPDGTIYASNDLGLAGIDRVKNGKVEIGWGKVFSANGMAVDPFGPYLYAAQTFQPAAIARVEHRHRRGVDLRPARPRRHRGRARRDDDRPAGPAVRRGQPLRRGLARRSRPHRSAPWSRASQNTSAVAFGSSLSGDGFPAENLYAVGFDGTVTEIPDARPRPATTVAAPQGERLVLRVSPRRVRAGRKVRIKLRVTFRSPTGERAARRGPASGSAARAVRTDKRGRATLVRRFRRAAFGARARGHGAHAPPGADA